MDGHAGIDYIEFGHEPQAFDLEAGEDAWLYPIGAMLLDPRSCFLHTCDDPGAVDAVPIDLAAHDIYPGDWIMIDAVGTYDGGGGWSGQDDMHGVFSTSSTLLAGSYLNRVPGAIDCGEDIYTDPTWNCGGESTDIPEDFQIDPFVRIRVPSGARYLFVAPEDSKYEDNHNEGRYGVQITKIRMKGYR
jgi:hypothetical protein